MRTAWYLLAVGGTLVGCGTKIAQTTFDPSGATPDSGLTPKGPSTCGPTLKERLTIARVEVDADVRYARPGFGGVARDERVALDVLSNGAAQVAWLDNGLSNVHVTPLTPDLVRGGPDVLVPGFDLGGLVAHTDGSAVLTRRNDPGDPIGDIPDAGNIAPAAFLVRVRNGQEAFAAPLTGTRNITDDPDDQRRDCSTGLFGKLAYNGRFYGAYFSVRGCKGDFADGHYGDKLVYADTRGAFLRGGWSWRCSRNLGTQLLAETNAFFTSLCISDGAPQAGVNVVVAGTPSRLLAHEYTQPGYSGADFGSVIKMSDGRYFVSWLSRGVRETSPGVFDVAFASHDIAFVVLGRDYAPLFRPTWLFNSSDVDEVNLHVAPYGPDRILLVWETVTGMTCNDGVCLGKNGGTHVRLIRADGWSFASAEEIIDAPPNGGDDIVVFPDGDLGWAFVPAVRDFANVLDAPNGIPNVPAVQQVAVARFAYCTN